MPDAVADYLIEFAKSVEGSIFTMMRSTFISYGGPDEAFAKKLHEALHENGVTTFFAPEHSEFGKPLHRAMRDGIEQHDRTILVCSEASLTRRYVLNEIEEALRLEAERGGEPLLIPITLDDYVFDGWKPPDPGTARTIRGRVIGDFQGADKDEATFRAGLGRLLKALRKPRPVRRRSEASGTSGP
jgi:hypothetical protein